MFEVDGGILQCQVLNVALLWCLPYYVGETTGMVLFAFSVPVHVYTTESC